MQLQENHGKMLTVKDGWLECPKCHRNKSLLQIAPDTLARNLTVYCRTCKTEHKVDIEKGQCFKSQGR